MSTKDILDKCCETCENPTHAINRHYCPECNAGVHLMCAIKWDIEYSGEKEPLCLACHSNGSPQKPTSQSAKRNYQEAMSDDEDNFDIGEE